MTAADVRAGDPLLTEPDHKTTSGSSWLHSHIPALDGLRGLAILLVMLHHLTLVESGSSVDYYWGLLARAGWCGVDLFFVLSGFLITGILWESKTRSHYFRNFYARRVLRIFPLYYTLVVLSLVVLGRFAPTLGEKFGRLKGDEWWYWLFLQNFIIGYRGAFRHGILDITWSLAIEEQFYLVWPLVVLLLSRRKAMIFCLACPIIAIACRTALYLHGASGIKMYMWMPGRIDGLAIGAFIALAVREPEGLKSIVALAKRLFVVLILIIIPILIHDGFGWGLRCKFGSTIGFSVLDGLMGCCLIFLLRNVAGGGAPQLLNRGLLPIFGKYSYAMYLFHQPIRGFIRDRVYGPEKFLRWGHVALPGQMIYYVMTITITLVLAIISWYVLEQPFLRLKRLFPSAR